MLTASELAARFSDMPLRGVETDTERVPVVSLLIPWRCIFGPLLSPT